MATIGNLVANIGANTTGLERGLAKAERRFNKFASNTRRAAAIATAAIAGVGAASYHLVKLASEAEELDNVINQSFGDMADSINKWSKNTASSMSRSMHQMRRFVAFNQAILKPMFGVNEATAEMSKNLTTLAVDMASFFNVADEQAFRAIQSGIMGEVEPLRRFGIDLTNATLEAYALSRGMNVNIETMSQAGKVLLRYNYLLENTSHIQGDAERTAGSFANRMKALQGEIDNLQRELGAYLLPIATKLVSKMVTLVQMFNNLDDSTKKNIVKWTALGTAVLGAVVVFGLLVTAAQLVLKAFGIIGVAISLVVGFIGGLLSPVLLLAVGLGYLFYKAWQENWFGIRDIVSNVWNNYLLPTFQAMWDWITKAWEWAIKTGGDAWDWLTNTTWQEKLEDMKGWLTDGWEWAIEKAGDAWGWLEENAPWLTNSLETIWSWSVIAGGELFTWIKDVAWPWLNSTVKTTWEWTIKGLDYIRNLINPPNNYNYLDDALQNNVVEEGSLIAPQKTIWDKIWPFATGGKVIGPGSGTSDSIVARLSNGEYVVNAESTRRFLPILEAINNNKIPGFADGGLVGNLNVSNVSGYISNISSSLNDMIKIIVKSITQAFEYIGKILIELAKAIFGEDKVNAALDAINSFKKMFDDIFSSKPEIFDPYKGRKAGFGPLPEIPSALEKFKTKLQETAASLGKKMIEQMPIAQQVTEGFAQGGVMGAFEALIVNSKVFATLMEMINPILQTLADIAGAVLLPVLKILENPLKILGEVLRWVAELIVKVWNGIVDALNTIIFWKDISHWKTSLDELLTTTDDLNDEMNEALRNVPSGFKIATARFNAAQPSFSGANGYTSKSDSTIININRPVYGVDDLKGIIKETMAEREKRNRLSYRGLTTAGGY